MRFISTALFQLPNLGFVLQHKQYKKYLWLFVCLFSVFCFFGPLKAEETIRSINQAEVISQSGDPENAADSATMQQIAELRSIAQEIQYLDEVLTTSTLVYAITLDEQWLSRYQEHVPLLSKVFSKALSFTHKSNKLIKQINQINEQLVTMEEQAIDLVNKGKSPQAISLLNSSKYREQKLLFTEVLGDYFSALETRIQKGSDINRVLEGQSGLLSYDELAWIKDNPTVQVHNEVDWPPFNFNENGKPVGFSIDYMDLLAKKIGFKVNYVTGPTWQEFLDMMKSGELDIMLNIVKTPERLALSH